ncbi:MAG: L-histidine N(alpha)-methyltransferase [Acidobacteriaceae bacterium]|nr:L-histidine N(alpha)-methyltransferase [Acidobacteriaceae bacterium]
MSSPSALSEVTVATLERSRSEAVAAEARAGLMAFPKRLRPWLFYDEAGSRLFEQITELPEYYLTRAERSIFSLHADTILARAAEDGPALTLIELGAGTAAKTGILLAAAVRRQGRVVYQPVDVSVTALEAAKRNILAHVPGVTVRSQNVDYTTEPLPLNRLPNTRTLALYIGSSIGNYSLSEALAVLRNLRAQLVPGDRLLLGTDLAPCPQKTVSAVVAAYNDSAGVTAAFNRNVLVRLNRELGADFNPDTFAHRALWNSAASRIEMHLVSRRAQRVYIPANSAGGALALGFAAGESIHTENSAKFTCARVKNLLISAAFRLMHIWQDSQRSFAVSLAAAV